MKPFDLITVACLVLPLCLPAQEALEEVKRQAYGNPFNAANENFINLSNQMDESNQFSLVLYDDWMPLEILGIEDNAYVVIDSANYHILQDKVIFVQDGQVFELYPEKIKSVILDDDMFISLLYSEDKRSLSRGYFEILEEGDYTLLRRFTMEREVRNDHPMGLAAAREVTFDKEEHLYYLRGESTRPAEVPRKKKDFIMIFGRNRTEMMRFAREHRLSAKRTDDVKKLFAHYNSLREDL